MRIAVLGAGNVGAALARGWSRSGHQITFGLRDIARHRDLLAETGARAMSLNDAASDAEVVVLALPWGAAEDILRGLGDLSGKIVIDAMNPVTRDASGPSLALGHTTSGGKQVASRRTPRVLRHRRCSAVERRHRRRALADVCRANRRPDGQTHPLEPLGAFQGQPVAPARSQLPVTL
jgi:hypothetical protein